MKYTITTTIVILGFLFCKAQTPILNRYGMEHKLVDFDNTYFKDTEDFRGQFVGTWVYTNGNTILKLVLQKKDMVYMSEPSYNYLDFLIGEFQYIENGAEKANTLNNLNSNHTDIWNYNIVSSSKITNTHVPLCDDCPTDAEYLRLFFDEPANDDATLSAHFIIRHVVENGVEKLKVQLVLRSTAVGLKKEDWDTPSTATEHTIPYGSYTLIKVED